MSNIVYNFKNPQLNSSSSDFIRNITEINSKTSPTKAHIEDSANRHSVFSSFSGINLGEEIKNLNENLFELKFSLQEPVKMSFSIKVNKHIKVSLLKAKIVEKIKEENIKIQKKINSGSFILMKKHTIIRENMTVDEAGIKDKENIHILIKANISDKEEKKDKKQKNKNNNLAPIEKLPNLTKLGYNTVPDFKLMSRMTEEELKKVKNFSIFNQFGKIEFLEPVDLTQLDLDNIVSIENKSILVYQNYKPEEGKELNKPANIHLYKCFANCDGNEDISSDEIKEFVKILKKCCKDKNV